MRERERERESERDFQEFKIKIYSKTVVHNDPQTERDQKVKLHTQSQLTRKRNPTKNKEMPKKEKKSVDQDKESVNGRKDQKGRTSTLTLMFFTVVTAIGAFVLSYQDDESISSWAQRVLKNEKTQIVMWTTFALFIFDVILARFGLKGRYYILHTVNEVSPSVL